MAQIKPGRPNSAHQTDVKPPISPGRLSHGATPWCLGFGEGPAGAGPLPPHLRGSLRMEVDLFKPGRPNSARPAAVQPRISLGRLSRGATPPCLGFGEGPACVGPLSPRLRGSLETEVAKLSLGDLTPPTQRTSSAGLARAGSHAVRHLGALDSVKVSQVGAPSVPSSGAVSRWKWNKLSLGDLTPLPQQPSSPALAQAASHVLRHLHALDLVKVPRARAPSLPASGAVSRRKWPKLSLGDLTPPPGAVQPPISPGPSHAVQHLRALDLVKVPWARAPSLPASGAVSRRKWPKLSLGDLTPPAQRPSSKDQPGQALSGVTPPCLEFGEGPAGAGPLRPLLRVSLETEVVQIKPG